METWRWMDTGACAPAFNMALDEALMLCVERPVLRFYAWEPPAISLGYFQRAAEVDVNALRAAGHVVVRRQTGGGAIYHINELTYSIALPRGHPLAESTRRAYGVVHSAIAEALSRLGVPARLRGETEERPEPERFCFERTIFCDIVTADDRKIVGSAQRRTASGFLMHGSIPLEPNPLAPSAASVNPSAPRRVTYDALKAAVSRALIDATGVALRVSEATPQERKTAGRLVKDKYGSDTWTLRR